MENLDQHFDLPSFRKRRPKHSAFLQLFRTRRFGDWMAIDTWLLLDREEFSWIRNLNHWHQFSPLLFLISGVLFVMRRLSLNEYLRAIYRTFYPSRHIPAWLSDVYLAIWFVVVAGAIWKADYFRHFAWTCLALFVVCQIVQINFYNNIWRVVVKKRRKAYNHGRNLTIGLLMLFETNLIFGLVYFWNREGSFVPAIDDIWTAIYFSFVTGATIGYGDIHPDIENGTVFTQTLIVFHAMVSTTLVTVIIGQAIGAVGSLRDYNSGKS